MVYDFRRYGAFCGGFGRKAEEGGARERLSLEPAKRIQDVLEKEGFEEGMRKKLLTNYEMEEEVRYILNAAILPRVVADIVLVASEDVVGLHDFEQALRLRWRNHVRV